MLPYLTSVMVRTYAWMVLLGTTGIVNQFLGVFSLGPFKLMNNSLGVYIGMVHVLLPLMILTGLAMSPGMDAIFPWLVDLFGGRQSARTIHFIAAGLIVLFVFVHVAMVLLAGPVNELRSMITGRFAIFVEDDHE